MKIKIYFICTLILFPVMMYGQNNDEFKREKYVEGKDTLLYRILYPEGFDTSKQYPLVLFMHGAGERGNDNEKQLTHGSRLFLNEKNRENFPAIVIFPQCPQDDYWSKVEVNRSKQDNIFGFNYDGEPNKALDIVINLLDSMLEKDFIDQKKIYLGGLSMGGMAAFELLYRRPDTFSAAIPICGGGDPETVETYAKNVDLWVFHGAKDNVVDPSYSKEMVEALKAKNANVRFTMYPHAGHNSWDLAFAEPELLPWLFSKSKH